MLNDRIMKENVLDVLIYLFENYMFDEEEQEPDQETLITELSQAGFDHHMIENAFTWLENLAEMCEQTPEQIIDSQPSAIRHYTDEEKENLNTEARGLIMNLEQVGVLNSRSREMVIDRLMALGIDEIDMDHLKWVILMVLSNYSDDDTIIEWTENLVLNGIHTALH